jgi:hypothetical protein
MPQQRLSIPQDDRLECLGAAAACELDEALVGLFEEAVTVVGVGGNGDPLRLAM